MADEWIHVTVCGKRIRVVRPVAELLGLQEGETSDDSGLLDRITEADHRYINEQWKALPKVEYKPKFCRRCKQPIN